MEITSLNRLKKISAAGKPAQLTLKISSLPPTTGFSLIELLSALEIIRHSTHLNLTHLSCDHPLSSKFRQALFQTRYYFPSVKVK